MIKASLKHIETEVENSDMVDSLNITQQCCKKYNDLATITETHSIPNRA